MAETTDTTDKPTDTPKDTAAAAPAKPRNGSLVRSPGQPDRVGLYLGGDDPAGPVVLWFAGVAAPYGADLEPVA